MGRLIISVILGLALLGGCATTQQDNPIVTINNEVDSVVAILAKDWPKASGAIRGGVGERNLLPDILEQMDKIDKWFELDVETGQHGNPELSDYQRYYIAFGRLAQSGKVLRAIIEQHAPGILSLPSVINVLGILGL